MQTREIESVGLVGVEVQFTTVELVAMKQFVAKLKGLDSSNKYKFVESAEPLIKGIVVLLERIVPTEVLSVEKAYNELFVSLSEPTIEAVQTNEL